VAILRDAGFKNVTGVDGGLRAWVAAGYPGAE
jgi:rhodanese-related sulfurtransferase